MSTVIDLSTLPAPDVIEDVDYETELQDLSDTLLALLPEAQRAETEEMLARESEPITKVLQVFAYKLMLVKQEFNERAKGLLLAYAKEAGLDHLGVTYYLTPRLVIAPAVNDIAAVMESDDDYLRRLLLAPDAWSTAGPTRSYQYHALKASPDILDAYPENAGSGVVRVTVLSRTGNGETTPELLMAVNSALSAEEVRPLNDTVQVVGATIRPYAIRAIITMPAGPSDEIVIAAAVAAAQQYANRRHRIGLGIVRDAVLAALWLDQVENVQLLEPLADLPPIAGTACYCTGIEVTT